MKMIIVGSDKIYAIENFYVKYLRKLGVNVCHFSAQSIFYDYYQKSILNKLMFKLKLSKIFRKINYAFKMEVEKFNPDIVWVFKGMEIFPETLQWVKNKGVKLVNYNPDSPFIFSGKGSGNENVTNSIPLYDLFLTYNQKDKKQMEEQYGINSAILPFGFDLSPELYEEVERGQEIRKVCFLGNPDKERGIFLDALAAKGATIDVYGNNWEKFVSSPDIIVFDPIYGDEFWKVLRKYRVQLNLMRPHNPDTHNMRSFEIPGVGGIQLAPDTIDHGNYFIPGKEIFLYTDLNSCYDQVKKIMDLSDDEALAIRQSARAKALQSGYSYEDRSAQALIFLNKI